MASDGNKNKRRGEESRITSELFFSQSKHLKPIRKKKTDFQIERTTAKEYFKVTWRILPGCI